MRFSKYGLELLETQVQVVVLDSVGTATVKQIWHNLDRGGASAGAASTAPVSLQVPYSMLEAFNGATLREVTIQVGHPEDFPSQQVHGPGSGPGSGSSAFVAPLVARVPPLTDVCVVATLDFQVLHGRVFVPGELAPLGRGCGVSMSSLRTAATHAGMAIEWSMHTAAPVQVPYDIHTSHPANLSVYDISVAPAGFKASLVLACAVAGAGAYLEIAGCAPYHQDPSAPLVVRRSEADDSDVYMATVTPPCTAQCFDTDQGIHYTYFLLGDVSTSMDSPFGDEEAGGGAVSFPAPVVTRFAAMISALDVAVDSLPAHCAFQVIAFGSSHAAAFPEGPVPYTDASKAAAKRFLGGLSPRGGTNLRAALRPVWTYAAAQGPGGSRVNAVVVLDGDTMDASGAVADARAAFGSQGARVFMLGLGPDVQPGLLARLAYAGGGAWQHAEQDVPNALESMMGLMERAIRPCFRVAVEWDFSGGGSMEVADSMAVPPVSAAGPSGLTYGGAPGSAFFAAPGSDTTLASVLSGVTAHTYPFQAEASTSAHVCASTSAPMASCSVGAAAVLVATPYLTTGPMMLAHAAHATHADHVPATMPDPFSAAASTTTYAAKARDGAGVGAGAAAGAAVAAEGDLTTTTTKTSSPASATAPRRPGGVPAAKDLHRFLSTKPPSMPQGTYASVLAAQTADGYWRDADVRKALAGIVVPPEILEVPAWMKHDNMWGTIACLQYLARARKGCRSLHWLLMEQKALAWVATIVGHLPDLPASIHECSVVF
jgi:hypothetical protein